MGYLKETVKQTYLQGMKHCKVRKICINERIFKN
jgi:hypothetical protein